MGGGGTELGLQARAMGLRPEKTPVVRTSLPCSIPYHYVLPYSNLLIVPAAS